MKHLLSIHLLHLKPSHHHNHQGNKKILYDQIFLVVLLLLFCSCNSVEKKRKTLIKYHWKDSSNEFLGYDVLIFDTVQSATDTGYFVVDKNMVVTKANRIIGTVTAVSNHELTIRTPNNHKFTYVPYYDVK